MVEGGIRMRKSRGSGGRLQGNKGNKHEGAEGDFMGNKKWREVG